MLPATGSKPALSRQSELGRASSRNVNPVRPVPFPG